VFRFRERDCSIRIEMVRYLSSVKWVGGNPPISDRIEPLEDYAVERAGDRDEALKHRQPMTAADRFRMHRDREYAASLVSPGVAQLALPDLEYLRRRAERSDAARSGLEVGPVVEGPADRDLDQPPRGPTPPGRGARLPGRDTGGHRRP
jgi:hypothetical protein